MAWHTHTNTNNNGSYNSSGHGGHNSSGHGGYSSLDMDAMEQGYYGFYSCVIFLGTTLNLWMLVALITSPEMRSRLRNKLLCMLLFNNFIKSTVVAGALFARLVASFRRRDYDCSLDTFSRTARCVTMWIENAFLIILLIRYLIVLLNCDPIEKFSPRVLRFGTILILVFPWIFSLSVVPSVVAYHSHNKHGFLSKGCLVVTKDAYRIVRVFGTVVPFFLKLALLVAILVFYYCWRSKKNRTASLLIGPPARIDDVIGYIAVCIVSALTQAAVVAYYVGEIPFKTSMQSFIFVHSAWAIVEARGVFMPLCFLFFSDLRLRLKTWRPWNSSDPDLSMRVQYQSKEDD